MTMLETLKMQRDNVHEQMKKGTLTIRQLFVLLEITYRIEVMESCQAIAVNAPKSTNIKELSPHFQFVDAFFHFAANDRKLGLPISSEDEQKKIQLDRKTAEDSLNRVVADCKKRMQSFVPDTSQTYGTSINKIIQTVLTAWIQHRNCYVDITKFEEIMK